MPRHPRTFFEGLYHLAPHASDDRHLFLSDEERHVFLGRLGRTLETYELRPVAYTLMGTHYHLVLYTPGGRIPSALQRLHGWYSRWHIKARGRCAHLFRAHYIAREIANDEQLLTVCRYLAYNPVAAGLAADPFAWPWSSAAASAGLTGPALPVDAAPLRAAFGDSTDWQERYRAFLAAHS